MNYNEVVAQLKKYNDEYVHGTRTNAKSIMEALCEKIEALPNNEKDELFIHMLSDICDTEKLSFLMNRGNGNVPYTLLILLNEWLLPRCNDRLMPELRWFYQINKNNVKQVENAYIFLQNAFDSKYADEKTYALFFEKNLAELDSSLHELPIGLLISDEEYNSIVIQCEAVIDKIILPKEKIDLFVSLRKQYDDFKQNIS